MRPVVAWHQAISLLERAHNALDINDSTVEFEDEEEEAEYAPTQYAGRKVAEAIGLLRDVAGLATNTLLSDDAAACERARRRILGGREAVPEMLNALATLLAVAERCFALTESGERAKVSAMDAARAAIAKATGSAA